MSLPVASRSLGANSPIAADRQQTSYCGCYEKPEKGDEKCFNLYIKREMNLGRQ
jgi:hypothetical protein